MANSILTELRMHNDNIRESLGVIRQALMWANSSVSNYLGHCPVVGCTAEKRCQQCIEFTSVANGLDKALVLCGEVI